MEQVKNTIIFKYKFYLNNFDLAFHGQWRSNLLHHPIRDL